MVLCASRTGGIVVYSEALRLIIYYVLLSASACSFSNFIMLSLVIALDGGHLRCTAPDLRSSLATNHYDGISTKVCSAFYTARSRRLGCFRSHRRFPNYNLSFLDSHADRTLCIEIARLQNSLQHLRKTQNELQLATDTDHDPELLNALEENNEVMSVLHDLFNRSHTFGLTL